MRTLTLKEFMKSEKRLGVKIRDSKDLKKIKNLEIVKELECGHLLKPGMYLTNSWLRYDESPNIGYAQANDVLLEIREGNNIEIVYLE